MAFTNQSEINKIDTIAVDGLLGTVDSLSYKVHEIESHIHNWERWFGQAVTPNAEIKVADTLLSGAVTPFQIDAGNNDWGSWVCILGSSDTPTNYAGTYTKYDVHSIQVSGNERNAPYLIMFAFGVSGEQALTDRTFTAKVLDFDGINAETSFIAYIRRQDAGTKMWARCKCPGQNTGTLDFWIGIHEYIG